MTGQVSIITMGGTIATEQTPSGALPSADHGRWLGRVLSQDDDLDVEVIEHANVSSRMVSESDMIGLSERIMATWDSRPGGVVVTHGTDTMEETAYALELILGTRLPFPLILTGAMRGPSLPGSDAAGNLVGAVSAALFGDLSDYGPLLLMSDELHLARAVTKMSSARVNAFGSPGWGPVAALIESRVRTVCAAPAVDHGIGQVPQRTAAVEIVTAFAGANGRWLLDARNHLEGLVVAGTGGGHAAPALAKVLRDLAREGLPVVLTSRCPDSVVFRSSYGGEGSEIDLLGAGVIHGAHLAPSKARLRLAMSIGGHLDPRESFARISGGGGDFHGGVR